jgi:hypothetical protein
MRTPRVKTREWSGSARRAVRSIEELKAEKLAHAS